MPAKRSWQRIPRFCIRPGFTLNKPLKNILKALLTWHQIEFPKTHDIDQLLELVTPAIGEAISRLDDSSELTPYGVDPRCPGDLPEPDLAETRRALELARRVRDTALRELPPRLLRPCARNLLAVEPVRSAL